MRILALDVGDRYVGVAVSDPLGITAQAVKTFERHNQRSDIDELNLLIQKYKPRKVVIGLPKNMNGTVGPQAEKILKFGASIEKHIGIEVVYWDERLTTVSADKAMLEGDLSRKKRKQIVDKIAAVFILQGYLDYENNKKGEKGDNE
ncbi:MAG TPA: Holliday junction resolvase RuvX [Clostridiales bacterium]|nr:Holliday junction resolvase RuvX [Clostridiales bacterium]